MENHNLIKIASTNCRGLGDYSKRKDVFNYLRDKKIGIYCLQDTHFTTALEPYIRSEWGGEVIFNSFTSNARGVCILFSNSIQYKLFRTRTDERGNMLILDLEIEGKRFTLANIYGPNDDSPNFFLKVQDIIEEYDNDHVIICGDFNLVQNQDLDTVNYINVNNPNAKETVLNFKEELNLVDPFREIYENARKYTWRKRNPVKQARLDFFLLSQALMPSVKDINIIPSYRSDHSSVVLSLEINEFKNGKGLWKFNTSLLKDKTYVEEVKKCINKVKEQYIIPIYNLEFINDNKNNEVLEFTISYQLFLEMLLMEIRGKTISYSAYKKKQKNEKEGNLIKDIEILENLPNPDLELIETKKQELENLRKEKLNGVIIRSRVRWAEEGEKPTKYFCSLESRNYINKIIPKVVKDDGTSVTDQEEILNEVKNFYKNLYGNITSNTEQELEIHNLLDSISDNPKLQDEDKIRLEGELSEAEILTVLKKMKNNKSPGSDGFTIEFFKFFYNDLKVFIRKAINEGYRAGKLSITQRQGIITCLPKGDKPKQFLKNWRPITLLNVIYKLASGSIAERIKKVLDILISKEQTGFMSGRYIGENTRLIYDILHLTNELDIPGLLLIIDFEKAFDSISWKFIEKILDFFNFGDSIKQWISTFYNDISASVVQCGFLSEPFTVKRGCRQGDPLSPYIFLLCAEILTRLFKSNRDIKGIKIADTEYTLSQFADDTTVLLDGSEQSLEETLTVLNRFATASGLKVNASKTRAVWIGSKKFSGETFNHRLKLDWTQNDFDILGIKFSCNLDTILQTNYSVKIKEIKKEINQWSKRILTPLGRITVLKTLLIAKLNHLFIALPNPSDETILKLNRMFFQFIWQSPTDRIKREVMCQDYDNGGLKMVQLSNYINALKISWIRRLIKTNSKYKNLFETANIKVYDLINRGVTFIDEIKRQCTNKFWRDVLDAWKKLIVLLKPKSASDIMGTCIWNNINIKINNSPVFYRRWYDKNIHFIRDLFGENGQLMTYEHFLGKYNVRTNFLEFIGIRSSIENYLRQTQIPVSNESLFNCHWPFNIKLIMKSLKGSKDMYTLLTNKNIIPTSQLKWERIFNNTQLNWKYIYGAPAKSCHNTKMHWFQFRIIHRIIATNDLLLKMNIRQSNLCTFCNAEPEKIEHLFWQCNVVNRFWDTVEQWIFATANYMVNIDKHRALFGISSMSPAMQPINYILIATRHYIYTCRVNSSNLSLLLWKNYVKKLFETEKLIAIKNSTYDKLKTHWEKWFNIFEE
ncbi:MAG: reverse transcriptase domain-containing protein [Candidatus Thiodiazotropha endolucinida]|nr:hypothetical protein [Candidatus Thiodiazotropha taylori]MCW4263715.1 reverse transcriptase domain-containing protein [Candidatus Thiodiazotropha endolucinida]